MFWVVDSEGQSEGKTGGTQYELLKEGFMRKKNRNWGTDTREWKNMLVGATGPKHPKTV